MSFDGHALRAFEHAGWQRAARHYDATFANATLGFIDRLLDAARVAAGARVLDIACGTGVVVSAVARRGARPTGLDFSAAMLALARAAHPQVRFDESDAEALPFADASFDAVVSNFGVHHFPDPVRALSEAHRVLRPGGRIAFTGWAAPAQNAAWKLLFELDWRSWRAAGGRIAAFGRRSAPARGPAAGPRRRRVCRDRGAPGRRRMALCRARRSARGVSPRHRADRGADRGTTGLGLTGDRSRNRRRRCRLSPGRRLRRSDCRNPR